MLLVLPSPLGIIIFLHSQSNYKNNRRNTSLSTHSIINNFQKKFSEWNQGKISKPHSFFIYWLIPDLHFYTFFHSQNKLFYRTLVLTKLSGKAPKKYLKGNNPSSRIAIEDEMITDFASHEHNSFVSQTSLVPSSESQVFYENTLEILTPVLKIACNLILYILLKFSTQYFLLFLILFSITYYFDSPFKDEISSPTHLFLKINSQIPSWEEINNNVGEGRTKLAKIWRDIGLIKTATFIENNMASDVSILQILVERLKFLMDNISSFPKINTKSKSNQTQDWENEEDAGLIEELQESILTNTTFVTFEGQFIAFDKFSAILYNSTDPNIISQDFPPQNVGAGRYIVGFNNYPQLELLARNFKDHKLSIISTQKYKEISNKDWENTSGAIFFLNGRKTSYIEIQYALAQLQSQTRDLVKRVHLGQDMGIIFVSTDKLISFIERVHYITIGENDFKLVPNISPEYHKGIGKLILMNCPLEQITIVKKILIMRFNFSNDDLVKIVQIKRTRTINLVTKYASYMIWIRGLDAIRKALLTVMDLNVDKKKISYFCWPIKKGEDILSISSKLK